MANFLTDSWNPFGLDAYYRKFELYQMGWQKFNVDLSDFALIAAQTNGGNIALIRDERKKQAGNATGSLTPLNRPSVYVFSSSGRLISQFIWNSGPLLQIGWSTSEELVCVQEDGRVLLYDMFGTFLRLFSMGQEAADARVIDVRIFENGISTGVVVLTTSRRFFLASNITNPTIRSMGDIPAPSTSPLPSCWTIVCNDRDIQLFLARENELLSLDKAGQVQQVAINFNEPTKAIIAMNVSPNYKLLALVTVEGIIMIKSAEINGDIHCQFDSKSPDVQPKQLAWCGNNCVVGYWEKAGSHILLMIGLKKDWINYRFDSAIHLVPESDCLRVFSRDAHDMIQKVPAVTMQVMKIGSMAPGCYLLEACREYEALSYKSDEYLKLVRNNFEEAITQCIDAASQEFDINMQKQLLRAASFGKAFTDNDSMSEKFVAMCKNLRVINALRNYVVGIPLTWKQFESLSISALIDKLVSRRQYELAYRICVYLELKSDEGISRVLLNWSSYKMNQRNEPDDVVARAIISKLEKTPGISFAECARRARSLGRIRLALDLLEKESSAQLQVPLLLEFGKEDRALEKAAFSGNSDLVYDVVLHMKAKLSSQEFLLRIRGNKEVFALFIKYCKEFNPKMVRDLFFQEDWHSEEAMTFIPESYESLTISEQLTALQNAVERFDHAKDEFNKKITEDQVKLIRQQIKLEEKFPNRKFVGSTVHRTLEMLFELEVFKVADEFRKDFQISERHFWFVKIDLLAKNGHFDELEKFSKSVRKPPVGFESFVLACVKYGNRTEAQKYLPKVEDEQKLQCCIRNGFLEEAVEFAIKQKDAIALDTLLERCRRDSPGLVGKLQIAKQQLGLN